VNARDKARAAKLRRTPDSVFRAEALRRGFEPYNGRTWIKTTELAEKAHKLELVVELMLDGRNEIGQLRTVRTVARDLRDWLKLSRELDPARQQERDAAE
jgi:hypothetical protein